jgi:hypothetical protein
MPQLRPSCADCGLGFCCRTPVDRGGIMGLLRRFLRIGRFCQYLAMVLTQFNHALKFFETF